MGEPLVGSPVLKGSSRLRLRDREPWGLTGPGAGGWGAFGRRGWRQRLRGGSCEGLGGAEACEPL